MSFWDEVYSLRKQGAIPRVWTRDSLRPHLLGPYTPNSISAIPSNQSMARDGKQIGNYVKNGREPKAWRAGPGEFQLVIDPDDDAATQDAERRRARIRAGRPRQGCRLPISTTGAAAQVRTPLRPSGH